MWGFWRLRAGLDPENAQDRSMESSRVPSERANRTQSLQNISFSFKLCIKQGSLMPLQQPPGKSHHPWLIRAKETQGSYSLLGQEPSFGWWLWIFWSKPGVWVTTCAGFVLPCPWEFCMNSQIDRKLFWISWLISYCGSLYWTLCSSLFFFSLCHPYWTLYNYNLHHDYNLNFLSVHCSCISPLIGVQDL